MNNEEKSIQKSNINWYPGHMAKTRKLIKEELNNIDIIYEVVDARIPYSSKINDIEDIINNKLKILIMTKMDLCDKSVTDKWIKYYEEKGYIVIGVDLKNNSDYKKIINETKKLTSSIQEKRISKGLKEKEIRALVIGIPNVGKSTLINMLARKKSASVGNKPGVTKGLNYLKTNEGITVLDTPGILWPKLDDKEVALNIASTGGIKKEVLNMDEICVHILNILYSRYPNILKEKYNIVNNDVLEMYEIIAKHIGALKNGEVLYNRVDDKVYNDVISGSIKGVTFDEWK